MANRIDSVNLDMVYKRPTTLGATDNLNTFDGSFAGEFFDALSAYATPANNYPVQQAGSLKVYLTSAGSSLGCVQEYRTFSDRRTFSRTFNGTTWSAWVELYSTGNLSIDRYTQTSTETNVASPDGTKKIIVTNSLWGAYDNAAKAYLALPVSNGGTGGLTASAARTNLETVYGQFRALGLNDNLNSLTGSWTGEYRCPANASATIANNYPYQQAGSVKVYRTLDSAGAESCVQEYRSYYDARVFIRRYNKVDPDVGAWTPWYEIITNRDPSYSRSLLQVVYQSASSLTPTDNLNNFDGSAVGEYYNSSNSNATLANNYPTTRAGSLKVYNSTRVSSGADAGACIQEYRTHNTNQVFLRTKSVGVWSAWVESFTSNSVIPIANGGTGRTDGALEAYSSQIDLVTLRPTAVRNSWISIKDENNDVRWRIGREVPTGAFRIIAYAPSGTTAAGGVISIDPETGTISSTKAFQTSGSIIGSGLVMDNSNYPALRWNARYTNGGAIPDATIGKVNLLEVSMAPGATTTSLNFVRRDSSNSSTNQIAVTFPETSGTLALQGTSGIDYKHDVVTADYSEAVARIDSLRMVNFVYNDDTQNRKRFGIIAEEAEVTANQYIKHNQEEYEDILDEEGNKVGAKYRDRPSVDNNPIVMDLLGYVRDLRNEVNALKEELKALKGE